MKIKKNEIFFYLSYAFLYISLFLGDVYDIGMISSTAKIIRLLSYGTIVVHFIYYKLDTKEGVKFAIIFSLSVIYSIRTGDLYWSILILYMYGSKNMNQKKIMNISIGILVSGTFCILILCCIGILPDVLTIRNTTDTDSLLRHSLGFYHSNVLPLIFLYIEIYYIFLKREKIRYSIIAFFMIISIVLKIICDARNAFYLSVILSSIVLIEKSFWFNKYIKNALFIITKYSVIVMSIFSYAMLFLLQKGGVWDTIDSVFSGRFRLAIFKMRRVGLHLVNFMSNEDFFSDSITYVNGKLLDTIVLDNGYIYVMLRYGIIMILFYFIVSFVLSTKEKGNIYAICALLVVFVANFVDNDLVDYSFLPFILFVASDFRIFKNLENNRRKFKIIWGRR